jgi:hypothetical protein
VILREWLETRTPAPPPRLLHRIVEILGPSVNAEAASAVLIDAAERLLRELTTQASLGRDSALDLLTVDALVTYAFEYAAASPESLLAATTDAIERLGAIAP